MNLKYIKIICAFLAVTLILCGSILSVPPHPDLLKGNGNVKKINSFYLANQDKLKQEGLDAPSTFNVLEGILSNNKGFQNLKSSAIGNFNVLAILVNFTDNPSATVSTYYDSLLFSLSGNTVRDYYGDISYGQLDLVTVDLPSSNGWQSAPQTYAYYVNGENGMNYNSYPNNAQKLVEDLVALVDPSVDFSNYDNNNDGYVDAVIIIHAGPGYEVTGLYTDIWSHKWNTKTAQLTSDGVFVYEYTIQPEYINTPGDMTIGVFCHELGHAFGLPDLYDIDDDAYGIGKWGIMSYGSWGGGDGSLPTHPCAWSRIQMGFASSTNIISNTNGQSFVDVKTSGDIYRLWTSGAASSEYFLVENRQKTGYDADLPGAGLLIWHIDDNKATSDNSDNSQEWYPPLSAVNHLRVAIEQADGLFEIEKKFDLGDNNDVFISGRSFNAVSSVTSDSYLLGGSFVSVENISGAQATMTADIKVSLAAGIEGDGNSSLPVNIELYQNYPNPFNPSTEIVFYSPIIAYANVTIYNVLGQSVEVLYDDNVEVGYTSLTWDGTNKSGNEVASGIYFYKLNINNEIEIKKMALIR